MLILSLLHMVITKGELFVPEEVSDSALNNEDSMVAKGNESDESADPFASAESPEAENELQGGSNENSSGLLDDVTKAQEDSPITTEGEAQEQDSLHSMGRSDKDMHTSVQTLRPGQVPRPGVPYWTEVYVDKKMKSVLVNVKTVTIIESINSTNKPRSSTTASSRTVDPYIKIQMPSTPASSSISRGPRTSRSISSSSKASSARLASRHQDSASSTPLRKYVNSMMYGPSKVLQSATSTGSSSARSSARPSTSSFARSSRLLPTATVKKEEAESANSLGSIFNVLKDMPYGGKSSESIYIEGTFNFPKKKSLSRKSFKMNGYISTV